MKDCSSHFPKLKVFPSPAFTRSQTSPSGLKPKRRSSTWEQQTLTRRPVSVRKKNNVGSCMPYWYPREGNADLSLSHHFRAASEMP